MTFSFSKLYITAKKKPGILEKPGIRQFKLKNNLEKPGVLNNFYFLSSKILI